jgi:hypothetical protein
MQTIFVAPDKLHPNPFNPNHVSAENMLKLERSITELGFVSAVVARTLPDGTMQILGGQHRVEIAAKLGIKEIPVFDLGAISDAKAKKVSLVDNSRYGTDDAIALAKLYEEIGFSSAQLAEFLPFTEVDFNTIMRSVEIDLDSLELPEDGDDIPPPSARPPKTHEVLRFRVSMGDAERIRKMVETTIRSEGFSDDDEMTAAGAALAVLLLNTEDEDSQP